MEPRLRRELFESMEQKTLEAFKGEGHVGVDLRELPHPAQDGVPVAMSYLAATEDDVRGGEVQ